MLTLLQLEVCDTSCVLILMQFWVCVAALVLTILHHFVECGGDLDLGNCHYPWLPGSLQYRYFKSS